MARGRTRRPPATHVDDALALAAQPTLADTAEGRALRTLAVYVLAARSGYAPTPAYWETVEAGDVFDGADGLWTVDEAPKDRTDRRALVRHGRDLHEVPVRLDDTIDVLTPLVEVVGLRLLADGLGPLRVAS